MKNKDEKAIDEILIKCAIADLVIIHFRKENWLSARNLKEIISNAKKGV